VDPFGFRDVSCSLGGEKENRGSRGCGAEAAQGDAEETKKRVRESAEKKMWEIAEENARGGGRMDGGMEEWECLGSWGDLDSSATPVEKEGRSSDDLGWSEIVEKEKSTAIRLSLNNISESELLLE
jgi:hypothetical protein